NAAQSPMPRPARGLFAGLRSHYDRLANLLSLGQDPRWRRFMVSRVRVPAGGWVLDVATGTAAVAVALAARTGASVVGVDQSEPMLRTGVARGKAAGLGSRVGLVLWQGQGPPLPGGPLRPRALP